MIDLGYSFTQSSQFTDNWIYPRLDSSTGVLNAQTDEDFSIELDFASNVHNVHEVILMRKGNNNDNLDRYIT
jgi:hypothetical protein